MIHRKGFLKKQQYPPIMQSLIRLAQKWSHSKIGWLTNKIALALAGWFGAIGVESDDAAKQIAAGVGAFLIALLEIGVKWSSNKLVKGIQKKSGLKIDGWPGVKTRIVAGLENKTVPHPID
tara:strand:+ start:1048 stop:1410 length:363 start_codon:yes stop_codon:yes gene_type:complete